MKIIVIGDLHGKDVWKQISIKNYDRVIFIGDYVDSFTHSNIEIRNNLLDLIRLKIDHLNKIILLLGNHDIQYLHGYSEFGCTGYRPEMYLTLSALYNEHKKLFSVAHQINNYLFTHAGVSVSWFEKHKRVINRYMNLLPNTNLAGILNAISQTKDYRILYEVGALRGGEYNACGGITWADIKETQNNVISGYHQIVGHHHVPKIITTKQDKNTSVTHIDVLNTKTQFHEIEIKEKKAN